MLALAVLSTRSYSHTQYPKPTRLLSSEPYIIVYNQLERLELERLELERKQQKPGTSLPFHDKLTAREPKRSEFIAKSQAARQAVKFRALIPAEPHFIIPKVTFGNGLYDTQHTTNLPKRPPKTPIESGPNFHDSIFFPRHPDKLHSVLFPTNAFRNRSSRDSKSRPCDDPTNSHAEYPQKLNDAQQRRCCTACSEWQPERWPSS